MANRVPPIPYYADNSFGSLPAACNVWRGNDADSILARTTAESTTDAGYTTAGFITPWSSIGQALVVVGEYLYDQLTLFAFSISPNRK